MTSLIMDPEAANQVAPVEDKPNDDGLPEKYRGKTAKEIAEMHMNAESELGRARNEVGTLRRLSDEFLGIRREELNRSKENPPRRDPITTDALLEKPDEVILSTVRQEIERREADQNQRTARIEADLAESRFSAKYPDAPQILTNPDFQDWVRSSPYRQRMALAASQGDYGAADELFGTFKERTAEAGGAERKTQSGTEAARKASLAKPGGSATSGVIPSSDGKKIYKRDELVKMRMNDPEGFDRLWHTEDLQTAYREKRVR